MIERHLVEKMLQAPEGWEDSEAQAQLRACLTDVLSGHDEITTIILAGEMISFLRDHLMGGAATVRRSAARAARDNLGLMPLELAKATRQTRTTIARLLNESRDSQLT